MTTNRRTQKTDQGPARHPAQVSSAEAIFRSSWARVSEAPFGSTVLMRPAASLSLPPRRNPLISVLVTWVTAPPGGGGDSLSANRPEVIVWIVSALHGVSNSRSTSARLPITTVCPELRPWRDQSPSLTRSHAVSLMAH